MYTCCCCCCCGIWWEYLIGRFFTSFSFCSLRGCYIVFVIAKLILLCFILYERRRSLSPGKGEISLWVSGWKRSGCSPQSAIDTAVLVIMPPASFAFFTSRRSRIRCRSRPIQMAAWSTMRRYPVYKFLLKYHASKMSPLMPGTRWCWLWPNRIDKSCIISRNIIVSIFSPNMYNRNQSPIFERRTIISIESRRTSLFGGWGWREKKTEK